MDKEYSFEKKDILLKELRLTNTLRLLKRYVLSVLRCSIKTWSTILAIRYKEIAFEIWCYRCILKIPYTALRNQRIFIKQELLRGIKKHRMAYVEHVQRLSSGIAMRNLQTRNLLQNTVWRSRWKAFRLAMLGNLFWTTQTEPPI